MTNAEARCNNSLRPRKPEGSLGRIAQDVHLDSHTAPELCLAGLNAFKFIASFFYLGQEPDKSDTDSRLSGFEYLSALKDKSKVRGDF